MPLVFSCRKTIGFRAIQKGIKKLESSIFLLTVPTGKNLAKPTWHYAPFELLGIVLSSVYNFILKRLSFCYTSGIRCLKIKYFILLALSQGWWIWIFFKQQKGQTLTFLDLVYFHSPWSFLCNKLHILSKLKSKRESVTWSKWMPACVYHLCLVLPCVNVTHNKICLSTGYR